MSCCPHPWGPRETDRHRERETDRQTSIERERERERWPVEHSEATSKVASY